MVTTVGTRDQKKNSYSEGNRPHATIYSGNEYEGQTSRLVGGKKQLYLYSGFRLCVKIFWQGYWPAGVTIKPSPPPHVSILVADYPMRLEIITMQK